MTSSKDSVQDYLQSYRLFYIIGEYWTHYKGGVYKIVSLAVKEDTLEPLIVYESLKHGTVWVRTISNFAETIKLPTGEVPRFKRGAP